MSETSSDIISSFVEEEVVGCSSPPSSACSSECLTGSGEEDREIGAGSAFRRRRTASLSGNVHLSSITTTVKEQPVLRMQNRTIYTHGRPPWYDTSGQQIEPFVIGICGGSASGKTTVARRIIEQLNVPWVTLLSMDSFYKILTPEQHKRAALNEYDFDHPDAFDFDLLLCTIQKLKEGKKVEVPIYNFVTHRRENKTKTMYGANVVIFEGILAFYDRRVLELLDMKVFVDTDPDVRLARRLARDIAQRGRDLDGVLKQYESFVKPSFRYYIEPTMVHADIIVPRGGENDVALSLIVQHAITQLNNKGFHIRRSLMLEEPIDYRTVVPENLFVLPETKQVRGLHTFIRNRDTNRDEFIFYSKRLMRLLMEYAVSLLPFDDVLVTTPQGAAYPGKRRVSRPICGVSILRAGETMEQALCDVVKDVRMGKILIQTNEDTGENNREPVGKWGGAEGKK
ncbi:unnamed protein product [Cyprideis torosa]|uniref:Uridine kinase n=1 Tax=Cyprideis torosa TaxID=163714 RepID=A0A7R8ZT85_9CRUS|nr:unnamed protein product [Cyprideis torosa]CAG0903394.1 unnamed protein product [Cyprideis torosa]